MWLWRLKEKLMLTKWAHQKPSTGHKQEKKQLFVKLRFFLSVANVNRGSIIKEPTEPAGQRPDTDVSCSRMPRAVEISIPPTHPHAPTRQHRENCSVQLIISAVKDKTFPVVIHAKQIKSNPAWLLIICTDVLFNILELRRHVKNWTIMWGCGRQTSPSEPASWAENRWVCF